MILFVIIFVLWYSLLSKILQARLRFRGGCQTAFSASDFEAGALIIELAAGDYFIFFIVVRSENLRKAG